MKQDRRMHMSIISLSINQNTGYKNRNLHTNSTLTIYKI
jgi:hypothetical protein